MRRLQKLAAVLMVLPTVGCVGGKLESGDTVVERFVAQVNDRTCDDASGFDVNQSAWSDACRATVDDLGDGVVLEAEPVTVYDGSDLHPGASWLPRFDSNMEYVNGNGVPTRLTISFTETGLLYDRLLLSRIDPAIDLSIDATFTYDYNPSDETIDPDGKALIEQVEGLLADGNCDEIEALMVPADAFGDASADDCPAIVIVYADIPAAGPVEDWWDPSVYSLEDVYGGGEVHGVARWEGEDTYYYADRVVAAIADTHKKLTKHVGDQLLTIEAVLHEGQWRLLTIHYTQSMDGYTF